MYNQYVDLYNFISFATKICSRNLYDGEYMLVFNILYKEANSKWCPELELN